MGLGRNQINLQVLLYASVMLLTIELLTVVVISKTGLHALLLIGIARIVETALFLFIISGLSGGLETIGLTKGNVSAGLKRGLIWSVCIGVISVVGVAMLYFFNFNLLKIFSSPAPASFSGMLLLLVVGGLFSPIAEEIFFRGIIYGFLRKWSLVLAILGSTLIFSMAHALTSGVSFIQVIGGLVFAIAYEVEKNLLVPVTIHVLGNMAIFTLSILLAP